MLGLCVMCAFQYHIEARAGWRELCSYSAKKVEFLLEKGDKIMAGKNTAAFGIYPDEASLRIGVETLQREGFRTEDISVLFPANQGTKDFAHERGTKAPEGAATGAGSGAVVGGV